MYIHLHIDNGNMASIIYKYIIGNFKLQSDVFFFKIISDQTFRLDIKYIHCTTLQVNQNNGNIDRIIYNRISLLISNFKMHGFFFFKITSDQIFRLDMEHIKIIIHCTCHLKQMNKLNKCTCQSEQWKYGQQPSINTRYHNHC